MKSNEVKHEFLKMNDVLVGLKEKQLHIHFCPHCGWKIVKERLHFASLGLWPSDAEGNSFFDFRYMMIMSLLQHQCPELSLSSILQALHMMTILGGKVRIIYVNSCTLVNMVQLCLYLYSHQITAEHRKGICNSLY
jgi:hypothetical protein